MIFNSPWETNREFFWFLDEIFKEAVNKTKPQRRSDFFKLLNLGEIVSLLESGRGIYFKSIAQNLTKSDWKEIEKNGDVDIIIKGYLQSQFPNYI